jgi:hypothetical protein
MNITIDEKREAIDRFCTIMMGECELCPIKGKGFCERYAEDTCPEPILDEWYAEVSKYLPSCSEDREPTPILESEMTTIDNRDNVNHPSHYETGKVECIDAMLETQGKEAVQSFCVCNAFKYLWRHRNKNQLEDVKKAIWYLNKFVELEENRGSMERI